MGWKGTMRSISAAGNRAARASERHSRAVSRIQSKAGSVLAALDSEVEKELQRIEKFEEKVSAHPVKALQLWYENGAWSTAPFKEQTGRITYSVQYKVPSQDVSFTPGAVEIGGVTITPRAISASQYFTAIAFDASPAAGEGGRVLKLVYPNKPEASRVAIASPTGEIFNPLDTNLDGRLFPGTTRAGIVTFEPFTAGVDWFEILFEAPPRKGQAEGDTVRVRVTAPTMSADMAACLAGPNILENLTEQLRAQQQQAHANVAEQVKKATSSGCSVVVALALLGTAAAVAFAL